MSTYFVRPSALLGALALVLLTACGPADVGQEQLKPVHSGMTRDSLMTVLGNGPITSTSPTDGMRIVNGYRRQIFVLMGQAYTVIWYRSAPGSLSDPITRERETPILLAGDTVAGWGWSYFNKASDKLNIPNPSHDKARTDSISRSQLPDSLRK